MTATHKDLTTSIPINNMSPKIEANLNEIMAACHAVIASGRSILGPAVKKFETDFSIYLGAKHCIGLANGTESIELGLKALGIGKSSVVATVANAGMYTTTALLAIGAHPFFIDVDLTTRNTTLSEVNRAIDAGVNAVVVTHLYGLATPEIASIAKLCAQKGIPLLEDCAQAHGAEIDGKLVGTFGDAGSFSFYPTKNLGALGDGGAIVTNRSDIAEKMHQLRQYGWSTKYRVEIPGARNSRLDEIQAAILSVFLPKLDKANARRREIAARYTTHINNPKVQTPEQTGTEFVAHLYVVQCSQRDQLREHLQQMKISSDIHYPIPDYSQPIFGNYFGGVSLPNTEHLAKEILTLPCYPELTDAEVDLVIAAVNSWQS